MTVYPANFYRNPETEMIRREENSCNPCLHLWIVGNERKCLKGKKATHRCRDFKGRD